MGLLLYISIIVFISACACFFYKDRLRLISAGVIEVFLGFYWLYLKMIPGRITADITGPQAVFAGWITVICGMALIITKPRRR